MSLLLLSVLLLGQTVGKVVAISDGDTIIIRPEQGASVKARLIGIDAPERGAGFRHEGLSGSVCTGTCDRPITNQKVLGR